MTTVYFVRHAQSAFGEDDTARPLTAQGERDRAIVLEYLRDKPVVAFYSSPCRRSVDTIAEAARFFGQSICVDDRFKERSVGVGGHDRDMLFKRWADFGFAEPGGETMRTLQRRNVAALQDVLDRHAGEHVVIGTHGTALSAMLNHYIPAFGVEDFLRIAQWMPYILLARFDGKNLAGYAEAAWIDKGGTGAADE